MRENNLILGKKWKYLQCTILKQQNIFIMQQFVFLILMLFMTALVRAQTVSYGRMAKGNAFMDSPQSQSVKFIDSIRTMPFRFEQASDYQRAADHTGGHIWLYVTDMDPLITGVITSRQRLHIGGKLAIDSLDNGAAADSVLTISNKIVQKAAVGDLTGEYTVKITTRDATPVTVFTLPTFPGNKYQLEVSCNGILDKGNAALEGRKRRGFLVDEGWSVIPGSLITTESTEYLGSGLSSADYTITTNNDGHIIVQAIGQPDASINFAFKIKVHAVWANL